MRKPLTVYRHKSSLWHDRKKGIDKNDKQNRNIIRCGKGNQQYTVLRSEESKTGIKQNQVDKCPKYEW